ncbi:MAG TPA: hypothetical protein VJV75_09230 [Candidatus Polarisedimenticolia bacterium]|nr:hypothetical protein [Candidatus Polarisedimenticolia bacterium]
MTACLALCMLAFGAPAARAWTEPPAGPAVVPDPQPTGAAPPLGRFHVWLKAGRTDVAEGAQEWGIDRIGYLAIEGFLARGREGYFGLEFGKFERSATAGADGDALRDVDSYWLELNGKHGFRLPHGLSFDAGAGGALFYIDGEEVTSQSGVEFTDPLADIGYGVQLFGDFNWRTRNLLVGLDVKYQWAFDFIDIDYSNLRIGAHLGVTF